MLHADIMSGGGNNKAALTTLPWFMPPTLSFLVIPRPWRARRLRPQGRNIMGEPRPQSPPWRTQAPPLVGCFWEGATIDTMYLVGGGCPFLASFPVAQPPLSGDWLGHRTVWAARSTLYLKANKTSCRLHYCSSPALLQLHQLGTLVIF